MKLFNLKNITIISVAALLCFAPAADTLAASAGAGPDRIKRVKTIRASRNQGLSGQKGKMRGWHSVRGGCRKFQKRYIAASGHSAYAATTGSAYQNSVCGIGLNKSSTARAEAAALASCRRGFKKWKVGSSKNCIIFMSK